MDLRLGAFPHALTAGPFDVVICNPPLMPVGRHAIEATQLPKQRQSGHSPHYDRGRQTLSRRLRRASPFCEQCHATTDLTTDHIIPVSEDPTLRLEPLNCRVLCNPCNGHRRNRVTDDERRAVREAIARRKARLTA